MIRNTLALLLAVVLLASCNQYKKTPSGVAYKITKGSNTVKLKNGQFIKFNIEYRIPPKDSVFNSSYGHIPGYLVLDTSRMGKHSFVEILTQCSVGDKVDFVLSVDSLKKMGMLEYNNLFHARDMIKGKVEILQAFTSQVDAQKDVEKEMALEKDREQKELKDYVAKLGAKTQLTPSGALVEIINAGDQNAKADSGKQAKLMYTGTVTGAKKHFDSNTAPDATHKDPLVVNVGAAPGSEGSVIKGMDEAVRLFGKGGKGRMFIPAMLAYGQNGQPPVIPAYASLVFDVEVVDVTTPPPPPPAPIPGKPMAPKK